MSDRVPPPPPDTTTDHGGRWTLMPRAGLRAVPRHHVRAARVERHWRWPVLVALLSTIPAFYAQLLDTPVLLLPADAVYVIAAVVVTLAAGHAAWHLPQRWQHLRDNPATLLLIAGLLASAIVPASHGSRAALALRLVVAMLTLLHMVWVMRHLFTRGSLSHLIVVALVLLLSCGVGFRWLEPTTPTLADGLWLAFTTAATVGYGDMVPTTDAAKIFSVFVVMLGFGVLSLVTAAIAASWLQSEERRLEREVLRDLHHELATLRREVTLLRDGLQPRAPLSGDEDVAARGPRG